MLAPFFVFSNPHEVWAAATIPIDLVAFSHRNEVTIYVGAYPDSEGATCSNADISKFHFRLSDGEGMHYYTPTECAPGPGSLILSFVNPVFNATGFDPAEQTWAFYVDSNAFRDSLDATLTNQPIAELDALTISDQITPQMTYSIASNGIDPAYASAGNIITLTFVSSELLDPNSISASIGGLVAESIATTTDNYTWAASRVIGVGETAGPVSFSFSASDLNGNTYFGDPATIGTDDSHVSIDGVPTVTIGSVTGPNQITLVFNEPVIATTDDFSNLMLGTAGARTVTGVTGSGTSSTLVLTFDGAPVNTDETALMDIAEVTDIDGEPTNSEPAAGYMIGDGQKPVFTAVSIVSDNASTTMALVGDTVTVTFTASEAVNTFVAVATIDGLAAVMGGSDHTITLQRTITSDDPRGLATFSLANAQDVFGNAANTATATTDSSAVRVVINPAGVSAATLTGPHSLDVSFSSDLAAAPTAGAISELVLTSGPRTVTAVETISSTTFRFTFNGADATNADVGTFDISPDLYDMFGQPIAGPYTDITIFDAQSPGPLTNISISSNNTSSTLAHPGDIITLDFTADTSINTPAVNISRTTASTTIYNVSGNTWRYLAELTDNESNGPIEFSIDYSDLGFNPGTTAHTTTNGSAVFFDRTHPILSDARTIGPHTLQLLFSEGMQDFDTSVIADFFYYNASFTATSSRPLVSVTRGDDATFYITFGGTAATPDQFGGVVLGGPLYDFAGNSLLISGDTVDVNDGQTPIISPRTIVSNNASTTQAKVGDQVTLSFSTSGATSTPIVEIAGHSVTPTSGGSDTWTATYTLLSGDSEGQVAFSITARDVAFQETTVTTSSNGLGVNFDKSIATPVITTVAQTTSASSIAITGTAENGATVSISGGAEVATGVATGGAYSITVSLTANSANTLSVMATDPAGNESSAATVVITQQPAPSGGGGGGGSSGGGTSGGGSSSAPIAPALPPIAPPVAETDTVVTQLFPLQQRIPISVGGFAHTITTQRATVAEITFVIESEPQVITLKTGASREIDTDADGMVDVRATYAGLVNGQPQVTLSSLVANEATNPLTINNGARETTSPLVTVHFNVPTAVGVALSNSTDFSGASFETYTPTKSWILSAGAGFKTVFARFRSSAGGIVDSSDSIILKNVISPVTSTTAPAQVPVFTNPQSNIGISNITAITAQAGSTITYNYAYKNTSTHSVTITVARELVNKKGQAVFVSKATTTLKPGAVFARQIDHSLAKTTPSGDYTVQISISDTRNKRIDYNGFGLTVLAAKQTAVGQIAVATNDSPLVFDAATVAKVLTPVNLPGLLTLRYTYTNTTALVQNLVATRELVDAQGRVIQSFPGVWTMKPNEAYTKTFSQSLSATLPPGQYAIRVRAVDKKTLAPVAENKVTFTIIER